MAKSRRSGLRYSKEQQQEDISRCQFCECMVRYGWLPEFVRRDIGEDILVRIRNRDQDTGVAFFAQLKSVTASTMVTQADVLAYRLDVTDLLHWEQFAQPVVLFVWNIDLREGYWALLDSVIGQLDGVHPDWRSQGTVTVHVPMSNTTDDQGLRALREAMGSALYQMIARGRPVEIHFEVVLPDTDEACPTRIALEKHQKEGLPVTIGGEYVSNLHFSDWWAAWFQEPDDEVHSITIGPATSTETEPVSMLLIGDTGESVHLPYVELRVVRAGTNVVVLSNAHQDSSIIFTVTVPRGEARHEKGNVTFTCRRPGYNVLETREQIRFLQGIQAGGQFAVVFHRHHAAQLAMRFDRPDLSLSTGVEVDPDFAELVDMLCVVQEETRVPIRIPEGDISAVDMSAANELFEIVQTGKTVVRRETLSLQVSGVALARELLRLHGSDSTDSRLIIRQDSPESYVELFGEKISVGPVTRTVRGNLEVDTDRFRQYVEANDDAASFGLVLRDAEIIEECSEWQHKGRSPIIDSTFEEIP